MFEISETNALKIFLLIMQAGDFKSIVEKCCFKSFILWLCLCPQGALLLFSLQLFLQT